MAKQTIDIGSAPLDGLGEPLRDAFDKTNQNFTEVYANSFRGNSVVVDGAVELETAVNTYSERRVLRVTDNATVTLTNGSPLVTATGTTWKTSETGNYRVDDLILFDTDTRYYKIKKITADGALELYESYLGSTRTAAMDVGFYYINWIVFILMPGHYSLDGLRVYPGQAFTSTDRFGVSMSEVRGEVPYPFTSWGENRISNITFVPTPTFSSLDGLFATHLHTHEPLIDISVDNTRTWSGMTSIIQACSFDVRDLGGDHAGGDMRLPVLDGGRSFLLDLHVINDNLAGFKSNASTNSVTNEDITPTVDNTKVYIRNCGFEIAQNFDSYDNTLFWPSGIMCNVIATYNISHTDIFTSEDFGIDAINLFNQSLVGIGTQLLSPPVVINLNHVTINLENTDPNPTDPVHGVSNTNASTINMTHCDVEVSGNQGTALYNNSALGVINCRHTRLKGSVNAINNVSGTVNAGGSTTTIGTVSGTVNSVET